MAAVRSSAAGTGPPAGGPPAGAPGILEGRGSAKLSVPEMERGME